MLIGEPVNILLVEDNLDHAELVIKGLQSNNVTNNLAHVEDGETALDYMFRRGKYAESPTSPRADLVLLDLRLPRIDGLEVLKALKNNEDTKRIPVVILTTSDAETDIAKAYDYHANSYLVKPVSFEHFMELMKTLGYYWVVFNKSPE